MSYIKKPDKDRHNWHDLAEVFLISSSFLILLW